ncbi:MAG: hypothetical protein ACRC7N_20495 [Clostridium sp.]
MNIIFSETTKYELQNLLNNSSENNIRIKVFRGCGKPAYEIFPSFKGEEDENVIINDISFVFNKEENLMINGIEIIYDKDKYINGYYIR